MKAILICIGTEITIGQIQDTNSQFLAKELYKIGVETIEIKSIKDSAESIEKALKEATQKAEIVITSGGLGPTKDDITKKSLSKFLNSPLVYNQEIYEHVVLLFKERGRIPNELNKEQAYHPKITEAIKNPLGTAPLLWTNYKGKVVINLPGVPHELKYLMTNVVLDRLKTNFKLPYNLERNLLCIGLPESELALKIVKVENSLPKNIQLAYLPSGGMIKLRLSCSTFDFDAGNEQLNRLVEEIQKHLEKHLISKDFSDLSVVVKNLFLEKKLSLCFAESCTGGFLSSQITMLDGVSSFYKGSVTSYATESKINVLGVDSSTIKEKTVVSQEVAKEMALGARKLFAADVACSTTGVAGPEKGEDGKEVGTLCFAIASKNQIFVDEVKIPFANREQFIKSATNNVFVKLIELITNN